MRRWMVTGLALAALGLGALALAPRSDARAAAPPARPAGIAAPVTVTLITGDRVTTRGTAVTVDPAPGREGITFADRTVQGHRYIFPSDALPRVYSGRLDRRLFDLTALAAYGSGPLPLLVSGSRPALTAGARMTRDLPSLGMRAIRADVASRTALWHTTTSGTASASRLASGVDRIWLDGKRRINLDVSVPQIGAPQAWAAGLDGTGVTVAVLDTGVDATHPDLAGRIAAAKNFTSAPDADDTVGHGTHVASTIAGSGAASGGRYRGVAPGATLLNGKVCGSEECQDSDILAGMAWAAPQAKVVNMSLGGDDAPGTDPLEAAVQELSARYDTLFVVAAGNRGHAPVDSPASAPAALAVGAVDRDDNSADFSSWGPAVEGTLIKPEITAPGVDIVAAKAAHATIGEPAPVAGYTTLSGTSMATPHVAGAAAILAQQHPTWNERQRKTALMAAARPTPVLSQYGQGAGRVDVARAIKQTVATDTGSVDFGQVAFPHTDDKPLTRTVTYRNDGSAPVALSLAVHTGAPAGLFTVGAPSLTVPAGGTASTTLTADTRVDSAEEWPTGLLTATGAGGVQVELPFGVHREGPAYNVTLRHTGRDGAAPESQFTGFTDLATFGYEEEASTGTSTTIRLPKGTYGLVNQVESADKSTTLLIQPRLTVDHDLTVDLDARRGRPIAVTVPDRAAKPVWSTVTAHWISADRNRYTDVGISGGADASQYFADLGGAPEPLFHSAITTVLASPASTYTANAHRDQRFYTGLTRKLGTTDLAAIAGTYAQATDGVQTKISFVPSVLGPDGWVGLTPVADTTVANPATRTDYVTTEGGVSWEPAVSEYAPKTEAYLSFATRTPVRYVGGRTYHVAWNQAVFAPSIADRDRAPVTRTGDTLWVRPSFFVDGTGTVYGSVQTSGAAITLYRGGTTVGTIDPRKEEAPEIAMPAGKQAYRLTATATRAAPYLLSTTVTSTWTFTSGHTETETALPLRSVRLHPALNSRNTAPKGHTFAIPLTVECQVGAAPATVTAVTVDVSYDDGRTWKPAAVTGSGAHRTATVSHPGAAGFASLRATVRDSAGGTVTQTVIRAYRIG